MDLNELLVFVRVVQAGSIRGAAERLGMPKSTVSRKVIELEARLDARLLQRTTRKLSLTDVGRIFYDHGVRIVAEAEDAERAVRSQHDTPRGLLRVTAPLNLALVGPLVSDYLARYPEVRLELSANARVVDLIEERFDVGLRIGRLQDSSLVAKALGTFEWIVVATPEYLARRGRPTTPADLKRHDCLLFGSAASVTLKRDGAAEEVHLTPRLLVTDMDVLQVALSDGLGVAIVPAFLCEKGMRAGRLEQVLPGWRPPSTTLHVVYPSSRHLSPTVRSFIDHVQERATALRAGLASASKGAVSEVPTEPRDARSTRPTPARGRRTPR